MSIFDRPDTVQPPPSWRCPACRTLQVTATRCWRCDRPAFTCESCHHYRPSVADGMGSCAQDPAAGPLRADATRSCWEAADLAGTRATAAPPATAVRPTIEPSGLFREDEIAPPAAAAPPPPVATPRQPAPPRRRMAKPPLEEPGRAAWVEQAGDALVEAPMVEPGRRLTTEVQRRRRRWFR